MADHRAQLTAFGDSVAAQIQALTQHEHEQQQRLEALEAENLSLTQQARSLHDDHAKLRDANESLTLGKRLIEHRLRVLRILHAVELNERTTSKYRCLKKEHESLKERHKSLESKNKSLEAQHATLWAEVDQWKSLYGTALKEHKEYKHSITDLGAQIMGEDVSRSAKRRRQENCDRGYLDHIRHLEEYDRQKASEENETD